MMVYSHSLTTILLISGCNVEIIEVSEIEFFIAKDWKLDAVYEYGVQQNDDDLDPGESISNYRLRLKDDFTYTRTNLDGSESAGEWALLSGLTQLVLFENELEIERWLVNLEPRELELKLQEIPEKVDGQGFNIDLRYILIPVRGQ